LWDSSELKFSGGTLLATSCEPVLEGGHVVGAVVSFSTRPHPVQAGSNPANQTRLLGMGLEAFTDTEQALAELVIQGLTNREAAARMFLSPHTIDFHLRKLYQKLGVRSRVELTRTLLQGAAGH
jgi:DNA-binding CsgD family transcriptional regulator